MENITYMGKQIYPRTRRGRFSRRWKLKAFVFIVAVFFIFGAPHIDGWLGKEISATNVEADSIGTALAQEIMQRKVTALQNQLIADISKCETKGIAEPDATLLLDSNSEMSIGSMQFQIKTVQTYVKEFEGRKITRVEAIQTAIDHTKATELARKILFQDKAWQNWFTCGTKVDAANRISLINSLTD